MKIKLISDLHVDCQRDAGKSLIESIPNSDHDLTIIAGDLCEGGDTDFYFDTIAKLSDHFKEILLVNGNHEYWGGYANAVDQDIDQTISCFNNVIRLKPGFPEKFQGISIHGGTLWFDDSPGWEETKRGFPDFSRIGNFVPWVFNEHQKFIKMFEDGLVQEGDIVVSHHLPSFKCVHPEYAGSRINRFFANNMDKYIAQYKPSHWLFGHTHHSIDMMLDNTHAMCNPHGYPGEHCNATFNENLIIEVGK